VPINSLILRGIHPPSVSGWEPPMHNGTQWGTGTRKGCRALLIRLVRTWVQIQTCPRRQKGSLITSQWGILATDIFGVNSCFSDARSSMEVWCCMRVYENESWDAGCEANEEFPPALCLSSRLVREELRGNQSKNTPLEYTINNFKKEFNGDYRLRLIPNMLKVLCE
jgi:hypothetical protein